MAPLNSHFLVKKFPFNICHYPKSLSGPRPVALKLFWQKNKSWNVWRNSPTLLNWVVFTQITEDDLWKYFQSREINEASNILLHKYFPYA